MGDVIDLGFHRRARAARERLGLLADLGERARWSGDERMQRAVFDELKLLDDEVRAWAS